MLQYAEDIKHKTTLLELQKMFTYLMVSRLSSPGPQIFKNNILEHNWSHWIMSWFNIRCLLTLQESERKAYNPRPFCKTYTMDKQPLNTGEQKDMTEFFTDLITKMEEMSQELVKKI